jgi:hypothetical protein
LAVVFVFEVGFEVHDFFKFSRATSLCYSPAKFCKR